ncbi:MAG: tRNA pseudouridine(13) synthase TruD [Promethearchaeota archaeon]|nr:MAG: tRNA pseudouridine(13) synthase TruD [Candidatus Lokiarchaeota archaeon]
MDYDYVFKDNNERELERFVGIKAYSTPNIEGIGGIYKNTYKDFIVKEITQGGKILEVNEDRETPTYLSNRDQYTTFNLIKVNRTTFNAIRALSKYLKIPQKIISYSGLKDKCSISVQKVSIRGDFIEELKDVKMKDLFIRDITPTKKRVRLGSNRGNNFTLIIRNIPNQDNLEQNINQLLQKLKKNGFPNYFGLQRFGTYRPNSHLIGRYVLEGDYERAIREFVSTIYSSESEDLSKIRYKVGKVLDKSKKLRKVYKKFPKSLTYECDLIEHLITHPKDYKGAFESLDKEIMNLIINAFQSYLFNNLISMRVQEGFPLFEPVEGDIITILDDTNGHETNAVYEYDGKYDKYLKEALKLKRAVIVAPIIGYNTDLDDFPLMKHLFEKIMKQEDINPQIFDSKPLERFNLRGTIRAIQAFPIGLKRIELNDDEKYKLKKKLKIEFSLNKGTYATMLIRELVKDANTH